MHIANILMTASFSSAHLFEIAVELSDVDAAVILALLMWVVSSGTPVVLDIGNLRHWRLHYDLSLNHHGLAHWLPLGHHRLAHWLSHHHLWLALGKTWLRYTSHPHHWLLLLHRLLHHLTWGAWLDRSVAHLWLLN